MPRFVVRKNTLPYVHQWAVIDTETGNKVGEYKTQEQAQRACMIFEEYGVPKNGELTPPAFESAWNALKSRMRKPNGDPVPKPPKKRPEHSDRRRVELDE